MELKLHELEFYASFFFFFNKFDRPISIATFKKPYNGVLNGTFFFFFFKFDRPIPLAAFKEPYSGI